MDPFHALLNPIGYFTDAPPPSATPNTDRSIDPKSTSIGGRTGISAYDNVNLPTYQNPYDTDAFKNSKYYNIATGDSMSPWSRLASQQQNSIASQGNSNSQAEAQGAAATGASRLAMQGGLTSGARERSQEQAGKNVLSMVQGNNQTAANNTANIGIQDAQQRQAMLGDATGKLTSMQASNTQGQNQFNQSITSMLNSAVAANNASNAQKDLAAQQKYNDDHSGLFGHGGLLGTGI